MATIASLNMILDAVTGSFERKLKKSEGSLLSLDRAGKGLGAAMRKLGPQLAGAISVTAIVAGAKATIDWASEMTELGQRTASSVPELQALEQTAQLAGTSLDAATRGIDRALKTLGQAQGGDAKAAAAFRAVNLEAEKLRGLSGTDLFGAIADGLRAIEDPAERAAAGAALLGRGWGELAPLVLGGSAAIDQAEAALTKAGLAMSTETAASLEETGDRFDRLWQTIKGFGRTEAAEPLAAIASGVATVAEAAFGAITFVYDKFHAIVELASSALMDLGAAGAWVLNVSTWGVFDDTLGDVTESLHASAVAQEEHAQATWDNAGRVAEYLGTEGQVPAAAAAAAAAVHDLTEEETAEAASAAKAAEEGQKLIDRLALQIDTLGLTSEAAALYEAQLEGQFATEADYQEALRLTNELLEARALEKLGDDVEALTERLWTQVDTWGLTAEAAALYELRLRGATDAQLASAEAARAQLEALEAEQEAQREADQEAAQAEREASRADRQAERDAQREAEAQARTQRQGGAEARGGGGRGGSTEAIEVGSGTLGELRLLSGVDAGRLDQGLAEAKRQTALLRQIAALPAPVVETVSI